MAAMTPELQAGSSDVMDVCEKVKLSCAELYRYFAYLARDNRELFLLWLKFAMEEENHARLFALVGKIRRTNIEFIQFESAEADVALIFVNAVLEKVKKNPPSKEDALKIAMEMKRKLDGFMSENVIRFANESCEKSFLAITTANSSYLESLQKTQHRNLAA
jgi:hypothetical protein